MPSFDGLLCRDDVYLRYFKEVSEEYYTEFLNDQSTLVLLGDFDIEGENQDYLIFLHSKPGRVVGEIGYQKSDFANESVRLNLRVNTKYMGQTEIAVTISLFTEYLFHNENTQSINIAIDKNKYASFQEYTTKTDPVQEIKKLPTVETQLMAWLDVIQEYTDESDPLYLRLNPIELEAQGFQVRIARLKKGADVYIRLATITIPEKHRGKGWFRAFRKILLAAMPYKGIYHENVRNKCLMRHFENLGFQRDPYTEDSFFEFKD